MHPDQTYIALAEKWLNGTITAEEQQQFARWYNQLDDVEVLVPTWFATDEESHRLRMLQQIKQQIQKQRSHNKKPVIIATWLRYAAAIIILIGVGVYFWQAQRREIPTFSKNDRGEAVRMRSPNNNKAILTLADGSQIILDDKASGNIAQQGNTQIIKLDDNQLTYNGNLKKTSPRAMEGTVFDPREAGQKPGVAPLYNTITTPRGSQYQIILPDGTKAWLNAASSIKFPTTFTSNQRKIETTGEIYLEVAVNKTAPFVVSSRGVEVQVLGTSFNINAYKDEGSIKTTLIDGSIKVILPPGPGLAKSEALLKPGQQASLADHQLSIINYPTEEVIAWKNGLFVFNNAPIDVVMRQLARWYNLEVLYRSKPDNLFFVTIPRTATLSEALEVLELTKGVHFKIEGNKIIVTL